MNPSEVQHSESRRSLGEGRIQPGDRVRYNDAMIKDFTQQRHRLDLIQYCHIDPAEIARRRGTVQAVTTLRSGAPVVDVPPRLLVVRVRWDGARKYAVPMDCI